MDENPYRSPESIVGVSAGSSSLRLAVLGSIIGGCIPFAFGVYLMGRQMIYVAQHPTPPGFGACGMPMVGALISIVIGTPLGAISFAAIGWLLGGCLGFCRHRVLERREECDQ